MGDVGTQKNTCNGKTIQQSHLVNYLITKVIIGGGEPMPPILPPPAIQQLQRTGVSGEISQPT